MCDAYLQPWAVLHMQCSCTESWCNYYFFSGGALCGKLDQVVGHIHQCPAAWAVTKVAIVRRSWILWTWHFCSATGCGIQRLFVLLQNAQDQTFPTTVSPKNGTLAKLIVFEITQKYSAEYVGCFEWSFFLNFPGQKEERQELVHCKGLQWPMYLELVGGLPFDCCGFQP